ncbi:MAG: D-aminoacylase [Sediminibacterium sp.]|nr:D-aminoacylase [Sediminibacterium sp.]
MKQLIITAVGFLLVLQSFSQQADMIIKNGRIIDGSGNSWYRADLAISNGKITAIGRLESWKAEKVIDANNLIIAPGFIDVHTHIEGNEAGNPLATNFIYDGVTTVIAGNCGSSNRNMGAYFKWIDSLRVSVNIASLIGQNDIRKAVMGTANRPATEEEMKKMESLMEQAMKDGAVGLSTGLIYIPGAYTPTEEIVRLAKIAGKYGGVYATHMRDEGDRVVEAIEEALHIGRSAAIPVQISHFKVSGQQNWGRSKETLSMVEKARMEGLDVTIDQYPYTASSTSLSTLLPDDVLADGRDSLLKRLDDPSKRKYIIEYMLAKLKKRKLKHWSYAVVAQFTPDTRFQGKSIEEINVLLGRKHKASEEALTILDIMKQGNPSMVFHGMSEGDIEYFMKYPFNMFASDASIRIFGEGVPHPRGYGTNARVLGQYVREKKVITLEEAIRRMTSLPAQKFNLRDRGFVLPGFAADLVIFDENMIIDKSTFTEPHQYSIGIQWVLVNGQITLENGKHTNLRNGQVLKKANNL